MKKSSPADEHGTFSDEDYVALASIRFEIRRFLAFAEGNARRQNLTMQQHQALLAVRADLGGNTTVGYVADRLLLKAHSASELIGRLVVAGLLVRAEVAEDRRRSRLSLTPAAEKILQKLSAAHRAELSRIGPSLEAALRRLSGHPV